MIIKNEEKKVVEKSKHNKITKQKLNIHPDFFLSYNI